MARYSPAPPLERAKVCALQNGRYHADREAWYDRWHRLLMLGVILGGSAALLDLMAPSARSLAVFATVAFGTIDLVFSLSDRARGHAFLRRRYMEIAARLEGPAPDAAQAQTDMMSLAAEEEPPYYAVHALAENWATRAVLGPKVELPCKVPRFKKLFRHFRRYDQESFSC